MSTPYTYSISRPNGKIIAAEAGANLYIRYDLIFQDPGIEQIAKTLTHEVTLLRDYHLSLMGESRN